MAICKGLPDWVRTVENDVGTLASGVTFVVSVLAGHPRLPVVQCCDAVAIDPATEAVLSRHMRDALLTDAEGKELDYPPHQRCVEVGIDLGVGDCDCTVYGSDMTEEYVHINADYRS